MPPKPSKTPKVKNLEVPDSPTIEAFMKEARSVWQKHHPESQKQKGRPSQMKRYLGIIWDLKKQGKINDQTKQTDICRLVLEAEETELRTKPELGFDDSMTVHDLESLKELSEQKKRAIRKYVRFWKLNYQMGFEDLNEKEQVFIEKLLSNFQKGQEDLFEAIFTKYGRELSETQFRDIAPEVIEEHGMPHKRVVIFPQDVNKILPFLENLQKENKRLLPDNAPSDSKNFPALRTFLPFD
ncbi:MAG TPA: hypothetical protein DD706_00350 [Nitrospiraceae bacterium]|nr:hypothetical protein [Nitrospiraceae bacterium]